MDNLTHTLFALALGRIRPLVKARLAVPMLVVAANAPDLDVVMRIVKGPAGYLEYHRGITHAFVGLALLTVLLALVAHGLSRRLDPTAAARGMFALDSCFPAIALGLASHFVLDYAISYGIRPWLPFSSRWYYGDLLFVVDPWLWLLFGGLAALTGARTRSGDRLYLVLTAFATAIVFTATREQACTALKIAWLPLLASAMGLRAARVGERFPRTVAAGLLTLTCAYFGLLVAARDSAATLARREVASRLQGEEVRAFALLPQPSRPWSWVYVGQTDRDLVWLDVEAFGHCGELRRQPRGVDVPELSRALATPGGRAWQSFVRFAYVRVLHSEGATIVRLSDARYWYTDFCTVDVALPD